MIQKLFYVAVASLFFSKALFAGGPENAVVVINAESASSKLIANHYIHQRKIPSENVIYLKGIPRKIVLSIADFRKKIMSPVIATIGQRKIGNHIDYIIYSSDFPTIIDARSDRKNLLQSGDQNTIAAANSKMLNPYISLTSATYFSQHIMAGNPSYLSSNANTYMRKTSQSLLTNPFMGEDATKFRNAISKSGGEQVGEAISTLEDLAKKHPLQLAVLYWLTRCHAWSGNAEAASIWLKRAIAVGWCYQNFTKSDGALAGLSANQNFQSIISLIPQTPFRFAPSYSFRSSYIWGPNGMLNSTPDQGNSYVLSTILAVNRNQGTSERETLDYLQRSISADGSKPDGTFYFTETKDVRTRTRKQGSNEAIKELRSLGYKSEIVKTKLPKLKQDIAGLSIGTANFDWRQSGNSILPGAICENLTSFGGRFTASSRQTKLTEFLRYGAAGSSGTVIEPFAIQAKFPHPRIHVHYVQGCTLAESFYQSVAGPFQLLVVGDALCKPWARIPKIDLSGDILRKEELSGEIEIKVNTDRSPVPVRIIEMYLNGRLIRRIQGTNIGSIKIDTKTMPDGFHEFRFVGIATGTIATRGSIVAPVVINNQGHKVNFQANTTTPDIDSEITFEVEAIGATKIQLLHNYRSLATHSDETASFKIAAYEFGRGPVKVEAVATFGELLVRSRPLQLNLQGEISTIVPVLKAPGKPKKKQSKPKK